MNYKIIIKSQQLRFTILRFLAWVPDSSMIRIQYRIKMGFWPDFKHSKRFTEKLQLYKIKYRNPVMHQCVDKYDVRKYIESKGLGHILNELYGIYNSPDEINFSTLPNRFVIKTTTGSGGQNVVIVKDKSKCDFDSIKMKLNHWVSANSIGALGGREWAYLKCKSRIIAEEYLEGVNGQLIDYKFFCFNGEPKCVQVDSGRFNMHYQNFYDMQWKSLGVHCTYPEGEQLPKPKNFDQMKLIAFQLSKDFPFVRVDLYKVEGNIYFGELTFYPSSGYGKFHPDEFDFELGNYFAEY